MSVFKAYDLRVTFGVEKYRFDRCDVEKLRTEARNALIRDLSL